MLSTGLRSLALVWPLAAGLLFSFTQHVAADDTEPDWAYRKLKAPALPVVQASSWVHNPIDAFVLAHLEAARLQPSAAADRLTLLKRVTHDLTGLAPTEAEREAFLNDRSPDAYTRVVERLLASQHFGQRWAQHWLDLVRFSESEGFKLDKHRHDAYRYRDYVIRALNADLPYDRFLSQQLAGDELEPDNPDALVATGFLRIHPEESNGANYRQIRQDVLDDITDVVGLTFLGLTIGCARCHDHKFDPIAQDEYFALQAFFTPLLQRDDLALASAAGCAEHERKMDAWRTATKQVRDELAEMLQPVGQQVFTEITAALDAETREALEMPLEERSAMQKQLALLGGKQIERRYLKMHQRFGPKDRARYDALREKLASYDKLKPAPLPLAMGVRDVGPNPPATHRLAGGDYRRPKEVVEPAFPECLETRRPDIQPPAGRPDSTGRRSALARWLSQPDHPLTARVVVNRLWAQYFGKGIVATPSDFGKMGQAPTHPELLDFLAAELVRQGWSLKTIHRLIVTSATYQQASEPAANPTLALAEQADPENKLLWHARVRRRDAEAIRDVALQVSGQLNTRMFGLSALPVLPKALMDNRFAWDPDEIEVDRHRRSVYVYQRRNFPLPLFQVFDAADRINPCAARMTTVTTPQVLLMLNGEFTVAQARHIAGRVLAETTAGDDVVRLAYRRVLGREPTAEDVSRGRLFIEQQAQRIHPSRAPAVDESLPEPLPPLLAPAAGAAVVDLCHALLNSAEFLYVD